jgi:hypothetical protein
VHVSIWFSNCPIIFVLNAVFFIIHNKNYSKQQSQINKHSKSRLIADSFLREHVEERGSRRGALSLGT